MNIKTSILPEKSYSAAGAGSSQQVSSNTQTPCSKKSFKFVKPGLGKLLFLSSLASANQNFTSTRNCPEFQLHCKDRNIEFTTSYEKNSAFCQGETFNSVLEEHFIPHIYPEICENLDHDTNKTVALGPENFNGDSCDSSCLAFMSFIKNDVFVTATIGIPSPQPSSQPTTALPTTADPSSQPTTADPSSQPTTALPTTAPPTTSNPSYVPTTSKPSYPPTSKPSYEPSSAPSTSAPTRFPTASSAPTLLPFSAPTSDIPSHSPTSPPSNKALTKEIPTATAGAEIGGKIGAGIGGLMFGIVIMHQIYKMKQNNHLMPRNVEAAREDVEAAREDVEAAREAAREAAPPAKIKKSLSDSSPDFSDNDSDSTR
tara:strand:- start:722 stop:1834 length:1113 start_codon:yes stop_codon:yes gene_type:complete